LTKVRANIAAGMFAAATFADAEIVLQPGDALILYTDGINEAQNLAGEPFGSARLVQLILETGARSPQDLRDAIIQRVTAFAGAQAPHDDITVLLLQT
jgi:sigma-B regulation protein RsbU (phosphoserine phosphatase)